MTSVSDLVKRGLIAETSLNLRLKKILIILRFSLMCSFIKNQFFSIKEESDKIIMLLYLILIYLIYRKTNYFYF